VAAIAHRIPHIDAYPHRAPTDPEDTNNGTIPSESPVRWLMYDFNTNTRKPIYVNGPSGIIVNPAFGQTAKMWGAFSCCPHAPTGSIGALVIKVFPSASFWAGLGSLSSDICVQSACRDFLHQEIQGHWSQGVELGADMCLEF
jgi:hypothetical protein